MELRSRALVVGGYLPPMATGSFQIASRDRITAIWNELAPAQSFGRLQLDRGANGVEFFGETPDDGLVIRPPLVQSRRRISADDGNESAGLAAAALGAVARHLGTDRILDLAVRTVCHLEGATPGFITTDLLRLGDQEFTQLAPAQEVATGVQYLISRERGNFDLRVEPIEIEGAETVLVTVEGRFEGPTTTRTLGEVIAEAQAYVREAVEPFLAAHARPDTDSPVAAMERGSS